MEPRGCRTGPMLGAKPHARRDKMGEPDAALDKLSDLEFRLLWMLDAADTALLFDGRVKWSLDADDLCEVIEIALELPEVIPGGVEAVRKRVAAVLGATASPPRWTEIAACWSDGVPMGGTGPCP